MLHIATPIPFLRYGKISCIGILTGRDDIKANDDKNGDLNGATIVPSVAVKPLLQTSTSQLNSLLLRSKSAPITTAMR